MMRVLRGICWLVSVFFILIFMFIMISPRLGWHFNVIPTGSMKPVFNPGGMVISRPMPMENIKVGDVILFYEPTIEKNALICHRVIEIQKSDEGLLFVTKGDANERPDSWRVSSKEFVGLTIYYIPSVGKLSYKTQLHRTVATFYGKKISLSFLIVLCIGLLLITSELRTIWQWISNPNLMRRKERLKRRKERIMKRRKERNLRGAI